MTEMDERKLVAALQRAAARLDLPERLQSPSGAVRRAASRRGRIYRWGAGVAAAVVMLVTSAGLTAVAQGVNIWPWGRQEPTDAERQAAARAYAAEEQALAELVQPAEAAATEVGALRLSEPVRAGTVTDRFGERRDPSGRPGGMHTGVDFAAREGDPVYAAADGTVAATGNYMALGQVVVITHGKVSGVPVSTWYLYNSALKVQVGQSVMRGDLVALAGATGAVSGPHVHFEVRVNGKPVNPMLWVQ